MCHVNFSSAATHGAGKNNQPKNLNLIQQLI